jgi:hypothetical protein
MPETEHRTEEMLLDLAGGNQAAHEADMEGNENGGESPRTPPARATVPDPFEGLEVRSPLRRKIEKEATMPEALQVAIWRLQRLSAYELVRENNIATNHELLVSLGLDKSFEEAMGLKRKKAEGKNKKGRRASKRVRGEGEADDEVCSEEEEEEEEEEEPVAPRVPRPSREKPAPKAPAPKEWVKKAEKLLQGDSFGPLWTQLVAQWRLREEQTGFETSVSRSAFEVAGILTDFFGSPPPDEEPLCKITTRASRRLGAEGESWRPGHQGHRGIREGVQGVVARY